MKPCKNSVASIFVAKLPVLLAVLLPGTLLAQSTTLSQAVSGDTFVSSGLPTQNFGNMGAMEIAGPTAAQSRTLESLESFNTAALQSQFNADYGAGNWAVTSVSLTLYSNESTPGQPNNSSFNKVAAGDFELDWLSNNNWSETTVTWNSLPGLLPGTGNNTLDILGDFLWPATGGSSATWNLNSDANLSSEIVNGGVVTILGQPTTGSTVGYLFNQQLLNASYLNVTVQELPEPGTLSLILSGAAALVYFRRRQN